MGILTHLNPRVEISTRALFCQIFNFERVYAIYARHILFPEFDSVEQ